MHDSYVMTHPVRLGAAHRSAARAALDSRWVLFCAAMVLCLSVAIVQASADGDWTFWMANFVLLGVLLNYVGVLRPRSDVFEPVALVAAMFLLAFVGRAVLLRFELDTTYINSWVSSNLGLLGSVSVCVAVGFTSFLVAYYCPLGPRLARAVPAVTTTWDMALLGPRAVRVYCLCLPAKLLGLLPHGTYAFQEPLMRYAGNVIGLTASLADVALLLCGIHYYHHKSRGIDRGRGAFCVMLAIQLAAGFLTGYREPLFISLLAAVFVRHYMWKPIKARTIAAGFVVLVLVVTPLSRAYRHLVWVEGRAPLRAMGRLSGAVADHAGNEAVASTRTVGGPTATLMNISNRFHGADSLVTCMATVPHYLPYQKGKTLVLLPLSVFVPRALWPGKPKIGLGTFFRENIWRGPRSESGGGQIAITQLGEFFINFGWWGVVVGMAVLGVLHRFAYDYLIVGRRRGNHAALLFYFAAALCFLATERNIAFAYGYLLKLLLFLYFLCRYLNKGPVFRKA